MHYINSILTERFPFTSLLRIERKVGKKINYKLKKGVLCCKERIKRQGSRADRQSSALN